MPTTTDLTPRQAEILALIRDHMRREGFPPTPRELMALTGIKSPNGIVCHLASLKRKGLLRGGDGGARQSRPWVPIVPEGCCPCCERHLEE